MAKDKRESKYAAEAKKGDAAVVPILRKVSGTRNARAFFMRKSTANLMERLSDAEQDAMIQIAAAWNIMGASHGYRQMRYGETGGTTLEDYSVFAVELVNRYREWSTVMDRYYAPDVLNFTIWICGEYQSIYSLCRMQRENKNVVLAVLRTGLDEWIKLRANTIRPLTANDNYVN